MILIIGHEEIDMPSDLVFNWVNYLGEKCVKLNGADVIKPYCSILINNNSLASKPNWRAPDFDVTDIKAVWMRRWMSLDYFNDINEKFTNSVFVDLLKTDLANVGQDVDTNDLVDLSEIIKKEFISQRRNEFKSYSHFFFELLEDLPMLGHPFLSAKDPSKAHQISVAKKVGLSIPDTLITNCKKDLVDFFSKHEEIICKNLGEITAIYYYRLFMTYTSLMTADFIDQLPNHFFTSIFQKAIAKEFEVRVFYLNGKLYSMAIFSNNDSQTKVDFRIYNAEKPNRNVPIKLPDDLEKKIVKFMTAVNLRTGSLDLILSTSGEYFFLEVNPVGQFSMVSYPCNYNLEKLVAEELIQMSDNEI